MSQSRDPQAIGRALETGGAEIGEFIDDLVKKAELQSPNKPIHEMASEMGFSYDQIPKRVIERMRKTYAMDNPMNYFYNEDGLLKSEEIADFYSVLAKNPLYGRASSSPVPVRFLRQFVGVRLDLDNQDHLLTFWKALDSYAVQGGVRDSNMFVTIFRNIAENIGYDEGKRGDLIAACLRNDTISEDSMFSGIARQYLTPTLLSSYFKPRTQGFGYDFLLVLYANCTTLSQVLAPWLSLSGNTPTK